MTYDAAVRITTLVVVIVFGAVLSGCAGPQVQMTVVKPPSVAEAMTLKRLAMGEFEGIADEASRFGHDVEDILASVRIQGKPYFEIVSTRETASALKAKKRTYRDLTRPDIARTVGSSLKADGIFLGRIVRSGATENTYQETRSRCTQSQPTYNKKGEVTGEVCIKSSEYTVSCIERNAGYEFAPRLIETATGRSIFSDTLKGSATDKGCPDRGRSVQDGAGLLAQARKDVLAQIRVALAPVENRVAVEIMESDSSMLDRLFGDGAGSMRSKESGPKFDSGYEYVKAGRMDKGCEIWKEMEPIENEYAPLLYNIGLCEESSGNEESARDYYTRADKLSITPDKKIAAALARIEKQIESKQMLTKARPDIFYRSAQSRTIEQDQKVYKYTAPNNTQVKIRDAKVFPERVKAGDTLIISMDYSVMAPKGTPDVNVQETVVLKKDGKPLKTFPEDPITRPLGGRISEVKYKILSGMPPGTYVIEQKVQAGRSFDVRSVKFAVGS